MLTLDNGGIILLIILTTGFLIVGIIGIITEYLGRKNVKPPQ